MSKPLTEQETREFLLEKARFGGYEKPLLDIFHKVDEAIKHAKNKTERDMITLQGLQEIDSYIKGSNSNLEGMAIKDFDQAALDKFNNR